MGIINLKEKTKDKIKYFFYFLIILLLFFARNNSIFDAEFTCNTNYCYICSDKAIAQNPDVVKSASILNTPALMVNTTMCDKFYNGDKVRVASYNTLTTYFFLGYIIFLLILGLVVLWLL